MATNLENALVEMLPSDTMVDLNGSNVSLWSLPVETIRNVFNEGLTHIYGNRASSDLVRKAREAIREAKGKDDKGEWLIKLTDVTGEEVKAWRAANESTVSALQDQIAAAYTDMLRDGSFAASARVAGMSAETKAQREAAKRVIIHLLSLHKDKDGKPAPMTLPTGKGSADTVKEFIDSFLADMNGLLTKNRRRFDTTLAEVKAEAAEAAKPKANLSALFGGDDAEGDAAQAAAQ